MASRNLLLSALLFAVTVYSDTSAIFKVKSSEWQALNESVDGRLALGKPFALPCYSRYDNGKETSASAGSLGQCTEATASSHDAQYLSDQFGGYITYQYGTCMTTRKQCPANVVNPLLGTCHQGSVSNYYIDVQEPSDVTKGLAFARKHNVHLAVKNTGHDYKGRSSAPGSLGLWVHNVQPAIQINDNFVPQGCSDDAGPAITYGAGQQFAGLYEAAHAQGYMMVGGTSPTVGASGGYLTGGGHSSLAPSFGLATDNVLELKVVLPNGEYVTANRCQNSDAFFALRGGGGNSFGVIMETTSRLHKEQELQFVQYIVPALSPFAIEEITDILVTNAPRWADEAWGGFSAAGAFSIGALVFQAITPKLTLEEAKESMQPLTDFAHSLGNLSVPVVTRIESKPDYTSYFNEPISKLLGGFGSGDAQVFASRLMPRDNFENEPAQLKSTLSKMLRNLEAVPFGIQMVAPTAYDVPSSDEPSGPGFSSVTPAWRDAVWHVTFATTWPAGDPTYGGRGSPDAVYRAATMSADPLRAITPGSGAYQNEADTYEPNAPQSFWGMDNYDRLLGLKQEWDPENTLTCHQCIGWDASDDIFSCYPKI